jgi:cysteine desulfurase
MDPIYLDHNATTPTDPRVLGAILPWLESEHGNPSSNHPAGQRARAAVDRARRRVADLLGCQSDEVVFTGGGSESNNLALKGVAEARRADGRHIIISAVEHPAVTAPAAWLERQGWRVTTLGVDGEGLVSVDALEAALDDETVLVSIMHANNETGALQPIAELATRAHARGALFHTDAAQSAGKVPVRVDELGVDLLTVAGHKLYAPKGVGALYLRHGLHPEPLIHGAGHESGRRAGTENVAFIAGLGEAAALAGADMERFGRDVRALRDRLEELLRAGFGDDVVLNGPREARLPNTLNVCLPGVAGDALLAACPQVFASTGSACHEDDVKLSPVLAAMGVAPEVGRGAVRLSLGRTTTAADVERAAAALIDAGTRVRAA